MKFALLLASILFSVNAFAAGTHSCDGLDSIGNLMEPTKTIGSAKIAYVSTEEPAAAPDHVLVFVYHPENLGSTCTAISRDNDGNGFGSVDMKSLKSIGYDSKLGRLYSIRVIEPNFEDTSKGKSVTVRFRANAITGAVTIE